SGRVTNGKGQHGRGEDKTIIGLVVTGAGGSNASETSMVRERQPLVPVLGRDQKPLDPCTPRRARLLLKSGRAVVARAIPFTIRLKDRTSTDGVTEVHDHGLSIDPGSKYTGMSIYRESTTVDTSTGE